MAETTIEWTDVVWNPTTGCDKVSPGCGLPRPGSDDDLTGQTGGCYALTMAARLKAMGQERYQADGDPKTSGPGFRLTLHPDTLDDPLHWRKPRRVFVNSMSDLFHPDVPEEFIQRVWETMAKTGRYATGHPRPGPHTYQILTKRPQRMANVVARLLVAESAGKAYVYPTAAAAENMGARPLPNVWLGTSIELDRYTFRADHLRATPAAVRFLSLEPLLGPLPSLDLTGIDWVIIGGESGPKARPMHPDWARDIRDRCVGAGIPFFFKQWGAWAPGTDNSWTHRVEMDGSVAPRPDTDEAPPGCGCSRCWSLTDSGWYGMARVGKKSAGRELDGRTWDEMPS